MLCNELLGVFLPLDGHLFVDGTVGGGGFSRALLDESNDNLRLVGLDVDPDAIAAAGARLAGFGERVTLVRRSFVEVEEVLGELSERHLDGMVVDLGISSNLLEGDRGFSYRQEGPLDMRMDPDLPATAAGVIAVLSEPQLTDMFRRYGEIRGGARLARAVKAAAREGKMSTTFDLVRAVKGSLPNAGSKMLARCFQALRIRVNAELENLEELLEVVPGLLAIGGRFAVISFHSLEDRLVKHRFRAYAADGGYRLGTRKPIVPSADEVGANPRARSAKLRWIERVG